MGKKNQAKEKKREEMERRREERRENITNRKSLAKERRKRQYNRAEDREWHTNFEKFSLQLKTQGLMIHDVAGDGNCLFRSIADQLYSDASRHMEVRQAIMDHIEKNPDNFQPFIEDDEPFDKYIKSMRKSGKWGGNIELQAASVLFLVNVHIYQLAQPRWDVVNHPPTARVITLSYHDGEHYNSVKPLPAAAASDKSSASPAAAAAAAATPAPAKKTVVMDKAERSKQFKEQAKQMAKNAGGSAAQSKGDEPTEEELALMQAIDVYDLQAIRAMMSEEPPSSAESASSPASSSSTTTSPPPPAPSAAPLVIPEDENEQLALALSLSAADVTSKAETTSSSAPAPAATSSHSLPDDDTAQKEDETDEKDTKKKEAAEEEDEAEKARRQHEKNMAKLAAKSGHMSNQRRKQIAKQEREVADKARKRERQLTKAAEKAHVEKATQLGVSAADIPPGVPLEAFQAMRI